MDYKKMLEVYVANVISDDSVVGLRCAQVGFADLDGLTAEEAAELERIAAEANDKDEALG